ncbi:MAG: hypothetical protein ACLU22_11660 [Clostridium sp.]
MDFELSYAVPEEGKADFGSDGFCMMKNGISGDAKSQQAAGFYRYIFCGRTM